MKKKIGLLAEGGGMKCAYGAAILDRFLDDGITFEYAVGVSAGAANLITYLAGQRDRNRRFYTDYCSEPDYFGPTAFLKTGNLFNLQYIYGTITNSDGKDPLDFTAAAANPTEFVIVTTDAQTGKPAYFHKEDMKQDDYRVIMASCAIPAACRPVRLDDGKEYYDGGCSDSLPVRRAIADGCTHLVVIPSKPRDYIKEPENFRQFYTLRCLKYPAMIRTLNRRHIMYNQQMYELYRMERRGRAFIMAPTDPPQSGTYTTDTAVNEQLYELGLKDYEGFRDGLMAFLEQN